MLYACGSTPRRMGSAAILALFVMVGGIGAAMALDVEDVRNLLRNQVSEDVIINMVKTDGTIYITPEEANEFRSMGASEKLVTALRPRPNSYSAPVPAQATGPGPVQGGPAAGYRPPTVLPPTTAPMPQTPAPAPVQTQPAPVAVQPAPTVTSTVTADGSPIFPTDVAVNGAYPALYHKEGWLSIFNRDWTTYYLNIDVDREKMFLSKIPNGGMAIDSGQNIVLNIRKHDYKLYGDSGNDLKVNVREGETTTLSLNPFGVFGNSGLTGVATDRDKVRSEVLFNAYVPAPTVVYEQPPTVVVEQPPVYVVPPPRPYYYRPYYGGSRYYRGGSGFYFNYNNW